MKRYILATAALTVPFWLATFVKAAPNAPLQSLPIIQPSVLMAQARWKEFASTEGGFAVELPGTPTEETETGEDGSIARSYSLFLDQEAYLINYADLVDEKEEEKEKEDLSPEEVQAILKGMPNHFVESAEGKLERTRDISLNGNPGKEFEFTFRDGISGKGRVYVVKKRFFLVVGLASQNQNLQKFLDSFRFL